MKKLAISFLISTLFLLGCNSAPLFGEEEGEKMTMDFVELVRTDPAAAYQETNEALQNVSSEEDFMAFSENPIVQHVESISVEGTDIESAFYDSDYGGAVARITLTGACAFTDGSTGTFDATWSYNFDKEKWEVEGLNFYPETAQ